MAEFTIRYWFGDDTENGAAATASIAYVSEGLEAASLEEATALIEERMGFPTFTIDSDGYGRVIINRDRVRFCSILPAASPEESSPLTQRLAAEAADNARRLF